jgi:hypothetical protein
MTGGIGYAEAMQTHPAVHFLFHIIFLKLISFMQPKILEKTEVPDPLSHTMEE